MVLGLFPDPGTDLDTRDERAAFLGLLHLPDVELKVPEDCFNSLQKTIFDALTANAILAAAPVSGRIFDEVPINTVFPYIRIGDFESSSWRTHSRPGEQVLITINIFSDSRGNKEMQTIRGEVDKELADNISLTMVGFTLYILRRGHRTLVEEKRGGRKIRQMICQYDAFIQQE